MAWASGRPWSSAAIEIGNTGKSNATPIIDKPAQVYHEPARMNLTAADRRDLFEAASHFLRTAVARKHLDSAWDLLGPEMKAGQTRKSWDTGNNDVIPFPAVGIATWNILYAYQNDVAIDLGVVGVEEERLGREDVHDRAQALHQHQPSERLARRVLGAEGYRRGRSDSQCRRAAAAEAGQGDSLGEVAVRTDGVPRPAASSRWRRGGCAR